jgi:putative lipoic acid-binding regulatory protein
MQYLPSIELLESTHRFPCAYMFKAIGLTSRGFAARTVAAVRDALEEETDPPFKVRETPSGKHVSVTVEPTVQTAEQVLEVYRRLRGLAGLLLLL